MSSALLHCARRKLRRLLGRTRGLRLQLFIHRCFVAILAHERKPSFGSNLDGPGQVTFFGMSADHAVHAEGLVKHYGRVRALDGLDLDVAEGSLLALMGPNGAGKTPAGRLFTTLLTPDAGRATIAGFDVVRDADRIKSQIGLAGQNVAIDEYLTGLENLEMIGRLSHLAPP